MIFPDIVEKVFAENGEKEIPPQLSPNNFVNFETGYTADYELRLNASNPQAKAVERRIQNYLFNQLTMNAKAWQSQGLPGWYANKSGGYERNALVLHVVNGIARPYRSLVDQNIAMPGADPSSWEYQQTMAEIIRNIPMPAGGAEGPSAFLVTTGGAAWNPTNLGSGSYFFPTDAAAQATTGLPITADGEATTRRAGLLEVIVSNIRMARYTDRLGNIYCWINGSSGSSGWRQMVDYKVLQSGLQNFCVALYPVTGNTNYLIGNLSPTPGSLYNGMRAWVRTSFSNTGAVSLDLNGTGPKPVRDNRSLDLEGGEFVKDGIYELCYNSSLQIWMLSSPGSTQRGAIATSNEQIPNLGQVKQLLSSNPSMTGAIQAFAHNNVGPEWLLCNGQQVSRATYGQLFTAIGTTYGSGDGSSTFNLPDTRGYFLRDLPRGSGRDVDRNLGSTQTSQNLQHQHAAGSYQAGVHGHSGTANSNGSHNHSASTAAAGVHQHVGSAVDAGSHTHSLSATANAAGVHGHNVSGNTSAIGDHRHVSIEYSDGLPAINIAGIGEATTNSNRHVTTGSGGTPPRIDMTGAGGAHSHTVSGSTTDSGSHTHSVSGSATASGVHSHTLQINNSGEHTHDVSVVANGAHTHTLTVDLAGSHNHQIEIGVQGGSEARPNNFAINYYIHI